MPRALPAGNDVGARLQRCNEARQFTWVVLQVAIHRHDDVGVGFADTELQGGRLAEISAQADAMNARIRIRDSDDAFPGTIIASVVDEMQTRQFELV